MIPTIGIKSSLWQSPIYIVFAFQQDYHSDKCYLRFFYQVDFWVMSIMGKKDGSLHSKTSMFKKSRDTRNEDF